MLTTQIISLCLGSVVGLILALTGAGGAILAVPFLIFGLHLLVAEAAPIALLAVGLSAAVGAIHGLKIGKVRYRAAALIVVSGMATSPIGVWVAHQLPNTPLMIIFSAVLGYVAISMFVKSLNTQSALIEEASCGHAPCKIDTTEGRLIWTLPCAWILSASGLLTGFLSGLLGVGGGFVVVPALKRASNLGMEQIIPTSLAVIALVSMASVVAATFDGHINWVIAIPFASGSMIGMLLGRLIAKKIYGPTLLRMFSIFAFCTALAIAFSAML